MMAADFYVNAWRWPDEASPTMLGAPTTLDGTYIEGALGYGAGMRRAYRIHVTPKPAE